MLEEKGWGWLSQFISCSAKPDTSSSLETEEGESKSCSDKKGSELISCSSKDWSQTANHLDKAMAISNIAGRRKLRSELAKLSASNEKDDGTIRLKQ